MGIDYSKQTGRKITTKGYKKKTVNIEDIRRRWWNIHLS